MQFCSFLLFFPCFFCPNFSLLRYAGFPFILIFCKKLSSHNDSAWLKKNQQNKTKKTLVLHTSFKKLLLSATLICNRSAPSSHRIFQGWHLQMQLCYAALISSKFGKQNADLTNHHNKFSSLWAIPFIKRHSELSFNLEYYQYFKSFKLLE